MARNIAAIVIRQLRHRRQFARLHRNRATPLPESAIA
jgi:hypothetical protein